MISIVTDSSACLPSDDAASARVDILPIAIHLQDAELRDGMPEAASRVYSALNAGRPAKSSAPSPLEYLTPIESSGAEETVIVTPAEEFTTMHRSARVAAEIAPGRVAVVDSRTAAAAQGLVVLAAAQAAASGAPLEDVVAVAEDAARRAELVAALEDLDHIRRSGRVPAFAVDLARRLGVRPVFRFRRGEVERLGVPRSPEAAMDRIRREWRDRGGPGAERSAVFHAAAPDRAEQLESLLGGVSFRMEFSPSMGIHTGPGVVGAAWLRSS